MSIKRKKLLITGFEDLGKYSKESISVIHKNIRRNQQFAQSFGWDICHYDETHGVVGTSSFLCESFPQIPEVVFSEANGWAERSDFARIFAILDGATRGYDVMAWLDADVFVLNPAKFYERKYKDGLHAPIEPWFNQKVIESSKAFQVMKQEQANGVLVSSGEKGLDMLRLMLEIMKLLGKYGDVEKRPWAQFGPKMLTRLKNIDYTTVNDGKGPKIREKIASVDSEIGLLMTNTISIDKYIQQYGLPQLFRNADIQNCNFVNMTPSSVKNINGVFAELITIS